MATHHTTFRESLGGQKVTIPNVYEILPEWKPRTHKEYKRAREDVLDPWIEKYAAYDQDCPALEKLGHDMKITNIE
jgi:hypothetical protein